MIKSKILKCITALILVPCAQLSATWTTPEIISDPAVRVSPLGEPSLALNNSNNAVVIWVGPPGSQVGVVRASSYTFNVGWSDPVVISSTAKTPFGGSVFSIVGDPQVSINEANQALAVWEASEFVLPEQENVDGVFSSTRAANGTWAPQEMISARDLSNFFKASDVRGCINDSGRCFAVWTEIRGGPTATYIMGNFKQIGGGWGTPFQISLAGTQLFAELTPSAAMNNNGDIVVTWMESTSDNHVWVATYNGTTNTWSVPIILPSPPVNENQDPDSMPFAAIDPAGNAVVTWKYETDAFERIYANSFTKAIGWGPSIILDETSEDSFSGQFVVMDPFGKATVIWNRFIVALSLDKMYSSFLPLGGTWSPAEQIQTPGDAEFSTFQILTPANEDPVGNVLAIFEDTDNDIVSSVVNYNGLGWQTPEVIFGPQEDRSVLNIQYGSCGFAIAEWRALDDNDFLQVFASLNFDLFAPSSPNFTGKQCCERFVTQKVCFNELTWTVNDCVSVYLLYRNGVLIATIPRAEAGFFREVSCGPAVYTLIAVSSISSARSAPATVTLP